MHQYTQHEWSPTVWAVLLLAMVTLVIIGMCVFLLFATRQQQPHHKEGATAPKTQERPRLDAGTARSA